MIRFDRNKLIDGLNRINPVFKQKLRDIFNNPKIIEMLNNNEFDNIYKEGVYKDNLYSELVIYINAVLIESGIDILNNLKEIPYEGFLGLPITEIYIPDNVIAIDYRAFEGCTDLTYVRLPGKLQFIGVDAFKSTPMLKTVEVDCNYNDFILDTNRLYDIFGGDVEVIFKDKEVNT